VTVAFYAPMKAPGHPVPSGDRTMARALIAALEYGQTKVEVVSELRAYDGKGSASAQDTIMAAAAGEVARLTACPDAQAWTAFLTYHNYYKAPDLIGPEVSKALGIPYLQVESTRAHKRLSGPWARFAAAAEEASDAAHAILYVTARDAETLEQHATAGQSLIHLPPFLPRTSLPAQTTLSGPMLSVGMMRPGDKVASYALIAATLRHLPGSWRLDIAGDGTARSEVGALMAPFGDRVRFLGALDQTALADMYGQARLLLWPGVNEAFGLAYLEAQAAGVPVVAQDRPGVREVMAAPQPPEDGGAAALTDRVTTLLQDDAAAQAASDTARAHVRQNHLLDRASKTLIAALEARR